MKTKKSCLFSVQLYKSNPILKSSIEGIMNKAEAILC